MDMTRWTNITKFRPTTRNVYHTNKECYYVTEDSTREEDANIDFAELEECSWCAENYERDREQTQVCPYCNEEVGKIPTHLPCEAAE